MAESGKWRLDDDAAAYFEAHFVPAIFADWASILVEAARVAPGQRVLDVGCGTGIVARVAADRLKGSGSVTGVDLNSSMINVARRLRPEIDWREGDAASLPFADGAFDVVVSQAALMFFPDRVAALREMRRVLRSGGLIAVQVFGASAGYELTAAILEQVAGKEEAEIFRAPFILRDPNAVTALFADAGLEAAQVTTYERPARYGSIEAFLRTEIDGWVLRGRVDFDAMLAPTREGLRSFCSPSGAVNIPMEGHIIWSLAH